MSLLTQPRDTLTEQMLLLDLQTLTNLCQVAPEIRIVCNDELFWRRKTALDFPEFSMEIPTDATYKTTFHILTSNDLLLAIQLNRPDVVGYFISRGHYPTREEIVKAVEYGAYDSLDLILQRDPQQLPFAVRTAARLNSVKLLRLLIDRYEYRPPSSTLKEAFSAGSVEAFRFIVESFNDYSSVDLEFVLTSYFEQHTPLEKERQREITSWLLRTGRLEDNAISVAGVILDDVELYLSYVYPVMYPAVLRYIWEDGSRELVQAALKVGRNNIFNVSGVSIDRLKLLLALGAVISPDAVLSAKDNETLLFLIDSVDTDHNRVLAEAAMVYDDKVREELVTGLLERRERLNLDRTLVTRRMRDLGAGPYYIDEVLGMFELV